MRLRLIVFACLNFLYFSYTRALSHRHSMQVNPNSIFLHFFFFFFFRYIRFHHHIVSLAHMLTFRYFLFLSSFYFFFFYLFIFYDKWLSRYRAMERNETKSSYKCYYRKCNAIFFFFFLIFFQFQYSRKGISHSYTFILSIR